MLQQEQQYDEATIDMLKNLVSRLNGIIANAQADPNVILNNQDKVAMVATSENFDDGDDDYIGQYGLRRVNPSWLSRYNFRGRVWYSPSYRRLRPYYRRARWVYYVHPVNRRRYYVLLV